jgi:hypothetical protein
MNGKRSKQLRRAARALNLPEATSYAPMGSPTERVQWVKTPEGEVKRAMHPVRQPFAMRACERKAMKEAKRLYKGQVVAGEEYSEPVQLQEKSRAFKDAVVDSMTKQPSAPSLGGPGAT